MNNKTLLFLKSALTINNPFNTTKEILKWIEMRNEEVKVNINKISFDKLKNWYFDKERGDLRHVSGKFFSIDGLHIKTNFGIKNEWSQPIINQPEIGFLGIITKEMNGVLYFLMQAKIEPGNVNNVQISPTLQATKSNYTQVHQGNKPLYLDYFVYARPHQILLDQLQSEQGSRFLRKRNRNIIIKVDEDIKIEEDFRWMTLGQIIQLIQIDNRVNMDTRTVISGISYGNYSPEILGFTSLISDRNHKGNEVGQGLLNSMLNDESSILYIEDHLSWLSKLKSTYELNVERIPLNKVIDWKMDKYSISHQKGKYFKVIAVEVEIANREVMKWGQPLVEPAQEGLCAFIMKKINGVYHFIVQAKLECGNFDIVELAPTVQCLTGNYAHTPLNHLPFLNEVLNATPEQIVFDTLQSEEGGRFFREQNRNLLIEVKEEFSEKLPENYTWMTLNQLKTFLKFNNYLNIQARSLIAAINFI